MRISKIRYKDGKTELTLERPNGDTLEKVELKCEDEPEVAFTKAIAALRTDLLALCELPKTLAEGTEVIGVSISENRGIRGFVISGRRKVSAGTFSVSTPVVRELEDEESSNAIPKTTLKRIEKLVEAATFYYAGKRSQKDLFADDAEEERDEKIAGAIGG